MPASRRALRAGAIAAAVAAALIASPASADVPEGWSNPEKVDVLHALLVFGGLPILIVLVVVILGMLPKLIKGEKILSPSGSSTAQWVGGPGAGAAELPAGGEHTTGGASGSY